MSKNSKYTGPVLSLDAWEKTDEQFSTLIKERCEAAVRASGPALWELGLQCLIHAKKHGDARMLDQMVESLCFEKNGTKVKSPVNVSGFMTWVLRHTPIFWNGEGKIGMRRKASNQYVDWNLAKAAKTPFWLVASQKNPEPMTIVTLLKMVKGMGGRVDKAREGDRFQGDEALALTFVADAGRLADQFIAKHGIDMEAKVPATPEPKVAKSATGTRKRLSAKQRAIEEANKAVNANPAEPEAEQVAA